MESYSSSISFRKICPDDYHIIKRLHESMFPVQYSETYYANAVNEIGINNGKLSTIIAQGHDSSDIRGFIFYQFLRTDECEDQNLFFLNPAEVCYILILGLPEQYRRNRIGSTLMEMCLREASTRTNCGAVYLHVIDYNHSAIKFYEKNSFKCLRRLSEHYSIPKLDQNGSESGQVMVHDAYLYIYYCNGYRAPLFHVFLETIRDSAIWFFNILSSNSFISIISQDITSNSRSQMLDKSLSSLSSSQLIHTNRFVTNKHDSDLLSMV